MSRTLDNSYTNTLKIGGSIRNRILTAVEGKEGEQIRRELDFVVLQNRTILQDADAKIRHLYFIENGLTSIVTIMKNGETSEAAMIGFEGVVGLPLVLGHDKSTQHAIVQIAGTALRMRADFCKTAFDSFTGFRGAMLQFTGAFMDLLAQTAACNRLHPSTARCARWLMMASDRIDSHFIPLTQDFLAAMLGIRRTGVTEIIGKLGQMGLIEHQHGAVTILDRSRLHAVACECYRRASVEPSSDGGRIR
jgi:CRP-like cAMP-binding protein